MTRYFISAGWPYLYDIPGLHNCVPMLFADVYARFFRQIGHEVFFLCGGDEHGSRVEFVAQGYGTEPQDLVNEKYAATMPLLSKLGVSLDAFGRTTDAHHQQWVRDFISRLLVRDKVYVKEQSIPYCSSCLKYLPDRFIEGKCPFCGDATYGGQCNNKKSCGKIIESVSEGRCALCGGPYELKQRPHLMFRLSEYYDQVLPRIGSDTRNLPVVSNRVADTFRAINEVSITRDSSWGIGITEHRVSGQSVYSWVDSLLAKVSFVAALRQERAFWKDDSVQRLFFLGMDGVPFYGALFPALLLAAGEGYSINNWMLLPNEVFIYEGGVCSKSTGTGIWLREALAVLEPDFWRFYVYYNYAAREKDADFRWGKFADAINFYLIDGLQAVVESCKDRANCSLSSESLAIAKVRDHLLRFEAAEGFQILLNLIGDRNLTRGGLLEALPLLSCFVPELAARTYQVLKGTSPTSTIVPHGKINSHEIRTEYQKLVDERRGKQLLQEELTNMRADSLCVCPTSLKEQ